MFGLFKKKSKIEKLQTEYERLLKEVHVQSTSNRRLSDSYAAEAHEISKQIERLQKDT